MFTAYSVGNDIHQISVAPVSQNRRICVRPQEGGRKVPFARFVRVGDKAAWDEPAGDYKIPTAIAAITSK
jgi:hypothetical protein